MTNRSYHIPEKLLANAHELPYLLSSDVLDEMDFSDLNKKIIPSLENQVFSIIASNDTAHNTKKSRVFLFLRYHDVILGL